MKKINLRGLQKKLNAKELRNVLGGSGGCIGCDSCSSTWYCGSGS